jgi:hypothetical protein
MQHRFKPSKIAGRAVTRRCWQWGEVQQLLSVELVHAQLRMLLLNVFSVV